MDWQAYEREKRDKEARSYDTFFPPWRSETEIREVQRQALRVSRPGEAAGSIVDVGCGTGRGALVALPGTGVRIGIDFSLASLTVAARKAAEMKEPISLACASALNLPLRENSVDSVVCMQVLQHLPSEAERRGMIRELRRVVRSGGALIISCYGFNVKNRLRGKMVSQDGLYCWRHTAAEVRDLLEGEGLRDVEAQAVATLPDIIGSPNLDYVVSRLPGAGLLGRTIVASGVKS